MGLAQRALLQQQHNPSGVQHNSGQQLVPGSSRLNVRAGSGLRYGSISAMGSLLPRRGLGQAARLMSPRTPRPLLPRLRAHSDIPPARGLYDPANDVDSCGERLRAAARARGCWLAGAFCSAARFQGVLCPPRPSALCQLQRDIWAMGEQML
jgi:hypothetical protein